MLNVSVPSLVDCIRCGSELSSLGEGARSMEEAAARTARYFHEQLVDRSGARCCALARFYKVHPFGELDSLRSRFAAAQLADRAGAGSVPCLTLLGTAGDEPAWCSPERSAEHLAIPLLGAEAVARMPMVARLIAQLGLQPGAVLAPAPEQIPELAGMALDVFHVAEARGSPFIPAQERFVDRYGIRSVIGFGGVLPTGALFAVILFSRTPIARDLRAAFRTLALSVKLAVLPLLSGPVFDAEAESDEPPPTIRRGAAPDPVLTLQARLSAVESILAEQARAVMEQASGIERLVQRREEEVDQALTRLESAVRELSAPVLEVWDGVLAVPLVGALDARAGAELSERLLGEVIRTQSRAVILDATGIDAVNEVTVEHLGRVLRAAGLLGARCVLTGLRPDAARRLVEAGVDLGAIRPLRNLKEGLRACVAAARR